MEQYKTQGKIKNNVTLKSSKSKLKFIEKLEDEINKNKTPEQISNIYNNNINKN